MIHQTNAIKTNPQRNNHITDAKITSIMASVRVLTEKVFLVRGGRCVGASGVLSGVTQDHRFLSINSNICLTHQEIAAVVEECTPFTTLFLEMPSGINVSSTPPTEDINPYGILGVPKTATPADIKRAYKNLALLKHPGKLSSIAVHLSSIASDLTSLRVFIPGFSN